MTAFPEYAPPFGVRTIVAGPGFLIILFVALLVIVVGSLAGQWLSIFHKMSDSTSFLWGHQGYEYVDLGRAWQIALFVGLILWFS